MRINKFIAAHSQFSRRKADQLIIEGRVNVNGKITKQLGLSINPKKDQVKVNGKLIKPQINSKIYLALNKPAGYITSRKDELGRKTVMELLPKIPNLKPIGRLDQNTEGLLLFSNDGEFINRHTHPKFECEKEYLVIVSGNLSLSDKKQLEEGIMLEGRKTSKAKIVINEITLRITIHEGRKRQIRKMFDYIHHPVKYLQRIRIGNITLGDLKKGRYRQLTPKEINAN